MPTQRFDSYAQNGEDVVLWRALGHIDHGRYVDVGANDPTRDSISRAFYDRGWRGITIEPVPEYAARHRESRPEDLLVEAAVTSSGAETVTLHEVLGTGLSTLVDEVGARHEDSGYEVHDIVVEARSLGQILEDAGWDGLDIHFMTIDVEAAEADVLASVDLSRWRPWVLVVEATSPQSTEPSHEEWESIVLAADYQLCLFDGLSRFYVAREHSQDIGPRLSYPASVQDNYSTHDSRTAAAKIEQLNALVVERDREVRRLQEEFHELSQRHHRLSVTHHATVIELEELRHTLSWRLTRPFRAARDRLTSRGQPSGRGGR